MIVWSIQPEEVYEEIMRTGFYHCDIEKSEHKDFLMPQYDWLASQMKKRVGPPPEGVNYPVWAWKRYGEGRVKPDLRAIRWYWGSKGDRYFRLELEIPDERVLLSDFDAWSVMLNDGLLSSTEEEDKELERLYDSLTPEAQLEMRSKNWERVFDVTPWDTGWMRNGDSVQATFWELRREDIRKITMFISMYEFKP